MTKKHYQIIADALKSLRQQEQIKTGNEAASFLEGYLGAAFQDDNPRFNKEKFYAATKIKK